MKALKIILSILLTIMLVVIGLATEILAIINSTLISPWFYKTALRQVGFYEGIRIVLIEELESFVDQQEGIPVDYKQDVVEIVEKAISKKKFARQMGDLFGDTINFFMYDKGDAEIPVQAWIDDLNEEISSSDIINEIDGIEKIVRRTLTDYLLTINTMFAETNTISGVFYKFLAPTEKIKERLDQTLWKIRYWINWLHYGLYIGIASLILLIALLFIIWRKKAGVVFKITGVLLIINSICYILSGAFMLVSITIAKIMNRIPDSLAAFTDTAQLMINPLGIFTLCAGIIILVVGIIILVIGSSLTRKSNDITLISKKETDVVSEIESNKDD